MSAIKFTSSKLEALNAASPAAFTDAFGGVLERSPALAASLASARPFGSAEDLCNKLYGLLQALGDEQQLALLRAHPELGQSAAQLAALTAESQHEQTTSGLTVLDAVALARLRAGNAAYMQKFGHPFIICARLNTSTAILAQLEARLHNTAPMELANAISQVVDIARLRVIDLLN
jgi:2-oxo-4-hydroxy-4-carboxy-5-ureidoimidazoline decarboxylase